MRNGIPLASSVRWCTRAHFLATKLLLEFYEILGSKSVYWCVCTCFASVLMATKFVNNHHVIFAFAKFRNKIFLNVNLISHERLEWVTQTSFCAWVSSWMSISIKYRYKVHITRKSCFHGLVNYICFTYMNKLFVQY